MNSAIPGRQVIAAWVESFSTLVCDPIPLPDVAGTVPPARPADRTRPLALLVSPHPDDECLTGGLALRLQREAGFEVVNVAATLGSNVARRSARWNELCHACARLGFALLDPAFDDCGPVTLARRETDWQGWSRDVNRLAALLEDYRPEILFCPHERDGSATHIGVHWLVRDALQRYSRAVWLAQTEFWGTLEQPNLLVELGNADVVTLIDGLTCHRGEIARNPYHLRLLSWLSDSVRRGGETVFGAGTHPPGFTFGSLYRLERWVRGRHTAVCRPTAIGAKDCLQQLFDEAAAAAP